MKVLSVLFYGRRRVSFFLASSSISVQGDMNLVI
jgi:hypothetical protein